MGLRDSNESGPKGLFSFRLKSPHVRTFPGCFLQRAHNNHKSHNAHQQENRFHRNPKNFKAALLFWCRGIGNSW